MAEQKKQAKRTYYAPYVKYSFYVPVIGDDGKKVMKRHPITQALIMFNGMPQYERVQKFFSTISANISKGLLCQYETSDPNEIDVLDGLVADSGTKVMNEQQYEKFRDPNVFAMKQELDKERAKVTEKEDVIEKLTKQIEELTRPSAPAPARK